MKVLMVLESSFPPDLRVENEIDALSSAGHEVHLVCCETENNPNPESYPNVTIHRKHIPKRIYQSSVGCLRTSFYFNWWKKCLQKLIKEHSFAVVHLHDLPLAEVIRELRVENGFKMILDLHENYPELLKISDHIKRFPANLLFKLEQWKEYEKTAVLNADKVVVVVEEAKDRLVKEGCSPEKITIVSNTFPENKFTCPVQISKEDELTLFYGGGITRHRGLQYVVQAIDLVKEAIPNIKFRIFGHGRYETELRILVDSLGVNDNIVFEGWKPACKMLSELTGSHVAIIPHLRSPHTDSTIPHKLFQYMAYGIPVLTSDCLPLARIVAGEHCGFVYHSDKPRELADCLLDLYRQPVVSEMMGENGKKAVHEKYLWDYDANRLKSLYKGL
ncbi:MAG: glycosyltransferase family 4 protein [Candidatus Cloacimonetes bacterium]|nr:glycosyltransferase family 4 protein [Candidatus Cloacimonadota bacterium]